MVDEVEIIWEDKPVKVEVGKMLFGDMIDLVKNIVSVKSDKTGTMKVEITDVGCFIESLILKSIKKAPFEINIDNIRRLSSEDGFKLFKVAQDKNPLALA